MAITKVAAFIQGPPDAMKNGLSSTPEADLASALIHLQNQVKEPLPYDYFACVYLPFFLVHALPGRSLIISGVGEPTISVRHTSIPSLLTIRAEMRSIEKVELVPKILGEFIQVYDKPPFDLIVIRNAMLPTMIETLRILIDTSIAPPREEVCLQPRLSTKEIHDIGILFRNERARLDANLAQLSQGETLIDEFVEEQLQLLDAKRDRMSHGASLRWETASFESEPPPSFFADEPTKELNHEKERISHELTTLISKLEKTLGLSTEQCRRLINQIQTKPKEIKWHLANVKTRLVELQNTANTFQHSIQQALVEIEEKMADLRKTEQRLPWSPQQPWMQTVPSPPRPFPTGTLVYSDTAPAESTTTKLTELEMIREAIVKLHAEFREIIKKLKNKIELEHKRFETISAPADPLQGYLPLMRLVVPIFVLKIGKGEGRYGVIPPLRIERGTTSQCQIKFFDDVFGEQLIQLMRSEIRSSVLFQEKLDELAKGANWITRPYSKENVQRGTRQLANYGLLTYETREQVANYWSSILSR